MSKLVWVRKHMTPDGPVLKPVSAAYAETIEALPEREHKAKLTLGRSRPQNNFYWSLLDKVRTETDLGDRFGNSEVLHKALLVDLGYYEPCLTLGGRILLVPSSTAFDAMGLEEFGAYLAEVLTALHEQLGYDPVTLLEGSAA